MSSMNEIVKTLQDAVSRQTNQAKPTAYDTPAVVRRVEGDIAWVHIPDGVDETPVKMTINAKEGDQVQVRVSGGSAFMVGNGTAPPTDDAKAKQAYTIATVAEGAAENALANANLAKEAADTARGEAIRAGEAADRAEGKADDAADAATSAQQSADSALVSLDTVQDVVGVLNWITAHGTMTLTSDVAVNPAHVYFIVDAGGDYVVGGTHYSIVSEPKDAELSTYYELTVDESVQNYVATHIAVDSEGLWLIPEDNATIASSSKKILIAVGGAGHTYSTAGTYIIQKVNGTDTVFAKFTADGATMQAEGSTQIAHLGYGPGNDSAGGTSTTPYYTLGKRLNNSAIGNYSVAEGSNNTASGFISHAEGNYTTASGKWAHAEGRHTTASGNYSHAEGGGPTDNTIASGEVSHVEGRGTTASAQAAHAEGERTTASGLSSHAEGQDTTASGNHAHAEGNSTTANGLDSHAEGNHTEAQGMYAHAANLYTTAPKEAQTAIGTYNIADTGPSKHPSGGLQYGKYAFIIGNGESGARSNALTVDWLGNVDIASGAKYKINGTALSASDVGAEPTLTNISESGGTYSGGIEDEKLLTSATITKLTNWLNS